MAQFILTAKQDINRPNGFHLDKGTQLNITIPMMGIAPGNLFGNNRCKEQLLQQFKMNGIFRGSGVIPWQSYPKMIDKRYMKNGRSDTPCS